MKFIENVAAIDIATGNHWDCGDNAMLIQIIDHVTSRNLNPYIPVPKHSFKMIKVFNFLDIDDASSKFSITQYQASNLVTLLQYALNNNMNVIVHCTAGICRSGAVVEVAEMMGFNKCENFRIPNTLVKKLMMKELGLTYE